MSYEGYYQQWCPNGHYDECDALQHDWDERCIDCGEPYVLEHSVDLTNDGGPSGKGWGYIQPEVDIPAVTETCEHCNHTRTVKPEIYKIPTQEQREEATEFGSSPRMTPDLCQHWWHHSGMNSPRPQCPCCGGENR